MACVVGVDIGGTKARVCVQHDAGAPSTFDEFPTGPAMDGPRLAAALRARLDGAAVRAAAIGVAVPGLVENGRVVASDVLPALAGWMPAEALGASAPLVVTLNDAKAGLVDAAAGEPTDATVALVIVGTGIGAAFLAHGRAVLGATGWAGELGSTPIERDGRIVRLDDAAAGAAILRSLGTDPAGVHARLAAREPSACEAVLRAGQALGIGLATLVNLLNPGRLVLAGGTLRYPGYVEAARDALGTWALAPLLAACRVDIPSDGADLVCRGAARHARAAAARLGRLERDAPEDDAGRRR